MTCQKQSYSRLASFVSKRPQRDDFFFELSSRCSSLFEHVLFARPVPTLGSSLLKPEGKLLRDML
jgi:hypothetical protein